MAVGLLGPRQKGHLRQLVTVHRIDRMRPARQASPTLALQNFCTEARVRPRRQVRTKGASVFQLVRCILAEAGEVAARQPLQPLFDLWEDATAIAEVDSTRL